MNTYLNALRTVLELGAHQEDRTGTGCISRFGMQMRYDMADGFPLLTTKKLHWKSIAHELIWFISGDTNTKYLTDNGVTIWNEWADDNGELGPVYGKQWRDFFGVDQITRLIDGIKADPQSRRHVVSAWNPVDVPAMALPPCHMFFQCHVRGEYLDLMMTQRSADMFLGVPFNIASYALLLHMLCHVTGYKAGELVHSIGNAHIYDNHMDQVREILERTPSELPKLLINGDKTDIFDITFDDLTIENYRAQPNIKAPVAV